MKRIYLSATAPIADAGRLAPAVRLALDMALRDLNADANGYSLHDLRWEIVAADGETIVAATAWIEVQVDEHGEAI